MTSIDLRTEFSSLQPRLRRLEKVMLDQLRHLAEQSGLTLGVEVESRLKSWESLDEKLKRKGSRPLSSIEDLLGLRVIFLFQRDLEKFISYIESTFYVHSKEDTSTRLDPDQFGYKSTHYILSAPQNWSAVPNVSDLMGLKVEVQVRTLPQHIWAAASHKLQYKQEAGVPEPIKRSIYRVSALLELVDLELNRVLEARDAYAAAQVHDVNVSAPLDVSVIEAVLDAELPAANKDEGGESYAELLRDLLRFSIGTRGELENLLRTTQAKVKEAEAHHADGTFWEDEDNKGESMEARASRGVYFTHVGLAREALGVHFGEENFREWLSGNLWTSKSTD